MQRARKTPPRTASSQISAPLRLCVFIRHVLRLMSARTRKHHVWRKLSAQKWEDVWPERLSEFVDRLAITTLPERKTIRLEVFALTKMEARRLQRAFGGSVATQRRDWMTPPAVPRPPIKVRGKLLVVASPSERDAAAGKRPVLLIPADMAFGTGEHATTATCLRLLADVATERADTPWEMLDLGCGSGILALAARLLGAARVEAGDFDPDCVRIAKEKCRRQWHPQSGDSQARRACVATGTHLAGHHRQPFLQLAHRHCLEARPGSRARWPSHFLRHSPGTGKGSGGGLPKSRPAHRAPGGQRQMGDGCGDRYNEQIAGSEVTFDFRSKRTEQKSVDASRAALVASPP